MNSRNEGGVINTNNGGEESKREGSNNYHLDSIFERISNLRQNLKNSMLNTSESKSSLAVAPSSTSNQQRPRSTLSPLLSSNNQNHHQMLEFNDKPSSDMTTGLNSVKAALSN
jgi:hypothetical protein